MEGRSNLVSVLRMEFVTPSARNDVVRTSLTRLARQVRPDI